MTAAKSWISFVLSALLLFAVCPAHAQVAVLGKGWLLDSAGSITSTPSEVISGNNSIVGSFSGPDSGMVQPFLWTNPTLIQFVPNATYTITFSYRILTAGSAGFGFGFNSSSAQSQGVFLPTSVITGAAGASGTATLTASLGPYSDIRVEFDVGGTGAIAVDDIRITNSAGQLFASENAEGPTLVPGLLNFQLTDAMALLTDASSTVRSAVARDLNGDGYLETILTFTAPVPSETPLEPIVIEASSVMRIATSDFFPSGAPTVKHSPMTHFADITGDGLEAILFAEAGSDGTPNPVGSRIGVALNLGGGTYKDASSLIPADQQTTNSYAIAVGDVLEDGRTEIILPDINNGANTAVLRWNGNGFDEIRNWIPSSLWTGPVNLHLQDWMVLADMDRDGNQDLLVSGVTSQPNLQIVFGAADGFTSATTANLLVLPDGPFGHTPGSSNPPPVAQGAEVSPVVVADFNNDGLPDIFATERQYLTYQPGVYTDTNDPNYASILANGGTVYGDAAFQVLLNQGSRKFTDVTSASTMQTFGSREYQDLVAVDINNDGFLDVVGTYTTSVQIGGPQYGTPALYQSLYGTTVFLNDGTGAFQVVDGTQVLAAATTTPSNGQVFNLGMFLPTVVNPQRTEGVVFESVGGCGLGFCPATGLNLYKVVANGAIGTGPNFVDPASLGVPGFNEFYYLRHYPDAAAAVQAGQYPTGLAQYLAVGKAMGYLPHAPNPLGTPVVTGVANAAGGQPNVPSGGFVSIYGSNFTPLPYDDWNKTIKNGQLPEELDGVSVTIGGKLAYVYAITPGQIDVQAPDVGNGPATVVVTTGFGLSAAFSTNSQLDSPAFFLWPNNQPVATHADYSLAAQNGTFPGTATVPAKPDEVITLWGTGFGPTNPPVPAGQEPAVQAPPTQAAVNVTLGGTSVPVLGAVLSSYAATYQIAIQIPSSMADGNYPILASVNGVQSPGNVVLTVHQ
jgi:uncharacterized protein (TIGR03437 family)